MTVRDYSGQDCRWLGVRVRRVEQCKQPVLMLVLVEVEAPAMGIGVLITAACDGMRR